MSSTRTKPPLLAPRIAEPSRTLVSGMLVGLVFSVAVWAAAILAAVSLL